MDKSLLQICKICGLYPTFKSLRCNRIRGLFSAFVLIALYGITNWNIQGSHQTVISKIMNATLLLAINIQATLASNIFHTEGFHQFARIADRIQAIERTFSRKIRQDNLAILWAKILLAHLLFLIFESLGYLSWGYLYIWSHLAECALTYLVFIACILQWNTLHFIWRCALLFNDELDHVNETIFVEAVSLSTKTMLLIDLQQRVATLCDFFNAVYGWHLFLNVMNVAQYFLSFLSVMLNYNTIKEFDLVTFFLINIFKVGQGIAVASKCEQVANEGKKSITNSYKTLQKYANVPVLREKLFILAQQATARSPKFTAAGFFDVNYSMLFTFINLITTYVIVIIQFSNNATPQAINLQTNTTSV